MLRSFELALAAAAAIAATSGLAQAQPGSDGRNFDGPQVGNGSQYSDQYQRPYGNPNRGPDGNQNGGQNQGRYGNPNQGQFGGPDNQRPYYGQYGNRDQGQFGGPNNQRPYYGQYGNRDQGQFGGPNNQRPYYGQYGNRDQGQFGGPNNQRPYYGQYGNRDQGQFGGPNNQRPYYGQYGNRDQGQFGGPNNQRPYYGQYGNRDQGQFGFGGPDQRPYYGPYDRHPYRYAPPRYAEPRNAPPRNGQQTAGNGGWLGVQIQPLDQNLADALKLTGTNGALVSDVVKGSPADTAGIRPGDVVVSVDGKAVNTPRDLVGVISGDQPGMSVTVSVWRSGAMQDIAAKLGAEPGAARPAPSQGAGNAGPASGSLGLTIAPGRGQNGGVTIASVDRNGPADRAGLMAGDRILAVGDTTVATTDDVTNAIGAARQGGAKDVLIRVQSARGVHFVAIPLG